MTDKDRRAAAHARREAMQEAVRGVVALAITCTVVSTVAGVGMARAAAAQTVDEIVGRIVVARGGLGRLHTVRTQRLSGHVVFSPTAGGALVIEQRRPNMIREEVTAQGATLVRAFDGQTGWTQQLSADPGVVQALTGDDLRNIAAEADFDGALIDARVKGNRVTLVGRDTVGGAPAYALQVTLRNGYVDTWYVDSASALPSKWVGARIVNGTPVTFESYFRDYLTEDGLRFARVIETGAQGSANRQQLVFDRVELNPALSAAHFAMPVDTTSRPAPAGADSAAGAASSTTPTVAPGTAPGTAPTTTPGTNP